MKCTECGCKLTPKEVDEYIEFGINQKILCDDCFEEQEHMQYVIDDVSDADSGL